MKIFSVRVEVMTRDIILDPQGRAVKGALHSIGFQEVQDVRIGKMILLKVAAENEEVVRKRVEDMSRQVLCNPIIENFSVERIEEIL